MKNIFFLALISFLLPSCTRQVIEPGPTDLGLDYYPLKSGHYVIYSVDSIYYNDFTLSNDTSSLELKDEVGAPYIDNEGDTSYIINRSKRYSANSAWQDDHTYYVKQDKFRLEWKENNLRFIKMVYPVKINTKWFGNSFLSTLTNPEIRWYDNWEYRYTEVGEAYNTGAKNYPDCHTIFQSSNQEAEGNPNDPNSFSAYSYGQEVFAKDVGMVYKELTRWEYQPSVARWRSGFTVIMRAKAHN